MGLDVLLLLINRVKKNVLLVKYVEGFVEDMLFLNN